MANLETGSQNQEYFETTGARELAEQEIQTMFDDDFFNNLESDDPLKKIQMQEIGGKVYFQKPEHVDFNNPEGNYTKLRLVGENNVFVDRFFISKEDWENIKSRRNNLNGVIEATQIETQQLNDDVTQTTTPELMGSSVEARVDKLLQDYEKFEKWPLPKRAGESLKTRNRLKDVVKTNIAYLKSIKRELKRYDYTYEPERFNENLGILEYNMQQLEKVRTIVVEGGDTSNIPGIIASLRDIKKVDKFETKMEKYYEEANKLLEHAALLHLANKDRGGLRDYLVGVLSGEIEHPLQDKFYKQYEEDFMYVAILDLSLYNKITTCQNPKKKRGQQGEVYDGSTVVVCPGKPAQNCEKKPGVFDKGGEMFADGLAKLGLIDENDTTKKEAWGKFGRVALLGLGAFAIYKIFTEKGGKRWAWIGGTAAVVLGMANKDGLYKWYNDAFGKSNPTPTEVMSYMNYQATGGTRPTSVETQEVLDNLISPSTTTISAIGDIDINDLIDGHIISTDNNGNFVLNYQKYKEYVENNVVDEKVKELNLQAGERLRDNPQWLHMGLAAMGITSISALQHLGESDTTLIKCDSAGNYCENLQSPINAEISKEGFKPKDNASWHQIMYENNGKSTISREKMARYIREGLIIPKDNSLALYLNSPLTNLEHKCMTNCGNIRFGTYEELLKAVKLTEWIMTEFKGRTARDNHPFHLGAFQPIGNGLVGNIQFNDGILGDTDVINANIIKNTLKEISPALDDNKHTYVNYLNQLWNSDVQTVREKVDLRDYPLLNAMGIDFYNSQEAKDLEEWLQDIKEGKKFSTGPVSGQPFSVKWTLKNRGDSLVFTAVNGDREVFTEDISKRFPTLMNHKDKFLAFLNNPANNMWGSAI